MKKGMKIAFLMAITSIIVALINNNSIVSKEEKTQTVHQINNGNNSQNFGIVNGNVYHH